MALHDIKKISIREYLEQKGINPKRENEKRGMYLSPLRKEDNASFSVDYIRNVWFDHGLGEGGSIIDLVARIENCSIGEAIKRLEDNSFSFHRNKNPIHDNSKTSEPTIKIMNIIPLTNPSLLGYLSERHINIEIAKQYCKEIHYSMNDKPYFAVGFQNNSGGYELRNKYFQGCTSKDSTHYDNAQNECLVFEGFTDFLSFLTLKNKSQLENNVIVLNSVVNLQKSADFLKKHDTIRTFLDNDEAGKRTFAEIQKLGKPVFDYSTLYGNFKDLNEYLCSQKQSFNLPVKKKNTGLKR